MVSSPLIWIILALSFLLFVALVVGILFFRQERNFERKRRDEEIDAIKGHFSLVAAEELSVRVNALVSQNERQVTTITKGMCEQIRQAMGDLERATKEATGETHNIGSAIRAQIDGVKLTAEHLGIETAKLTEALLGNSKRQGIWGEAVLAGVLERCGLEKGVHYFCQESVTLEDSGKKIPDVQVCDPGGRWLVIDSKVSLKDYLMACNAKDSEERKKALKRHTESVKKHIVELAKKKYPQNLRLAYPERIYFDQVAMFVPNEAAHMAAMEMEPTLSQYAIEQDVIFVTPNTLLGYLQLVRHAWVEHEVSQNHEKIVHAATVLLERVNRSLKELEGVGDAIEKAQKQYDMAMGVLTGRGGAQNIVTPIETLRKVGIQMPADPKLAKTLKNKVE